MADFLLKYGHVPRNILPLDLANDIVNLRVCAAMLPARADMMRWQALRAAGYTGPTREGGTAIVQAYELSTADQLGLARQTPPLFPEGAPPPQ